MESRNKKGVNHGSETPPPTGNVCSAYQILWGHNPTLDGKHTEPPGISRKATDVSRVLFLY